MKARDVMVFPVITVKPQSSVKDVAKVFLEHRISAVPVVEDDGRIVGIVSEGDLLHRAEAGTERRRSWWLEFVAQNDVLTSDYIKAHSNIVADIMTREVVTASPDTPLYEIATLLETKMIKRVPIVENGQLVGIVSRANLIQAVASERKETVTPETDAVVREQVLRSLKNQKWAHTTLLNATAADGVVDLWGFVNSEQERKAIRLLVESNPSVREIRDNMTLRPRSGGA